jgi:hypothetical protein
MSVYRLAKIAAFVFMIVTHGFLLSFQIGNVYVKFREEEHAAAALNALSGRFYAGL